ncbi:MAG: class I SAM-dependent methyltransferase [Anaerolineae bacterium]|jgi:SAM-dependent methyltransferase|nr:class I SAM-dependent methyltransferase [Anaerolineae bacterium]MBT7782288.1 class I SAM-dependent methyltransferase [Anaerolineae bacterium]
MSKYTDQTYLKTDQYKDASNLDARILLHERFSENKQGWASWIFDTYEKLPSSAKVLELGSGSAFIWTTCPERIPADWQITLSDLSPGMLAAAQENLAEVSHGFSYREIDAQSIPFDDETFDIVIANHMLYHVPDRPKALAEIRRVLKSDGIFIAATSGENHLAEINKWLKAISPDPDFIPFRNPFTLDNGLEQLKPYFSPIEIMRYEDNLHVTDIELMINYINSTTKVKGVPSSALYKVQIELESLLATKDEIFIQKDSGIFKAIK